MLARAWSRLVFASGGVKGFPLGTWLLSGSKSRMSGCRGSNACPPDSQGWTWRIGGFADFWKLSSTCFSVQEARPGPALSIIVLWPRARCCGVVGAGLRCDRGKVEIFRTLRGRTVRGVLVARAFYVRARVFLSCIVVLMRAAGG